MASRSNPDRATRPVLRWLAALGAALAAGPALPAPVEVTVTDATGKPLPGAVVWVDSAAARAAARPRTGAEVVQQNKAFVPDVVVVTVGTAVEFPNRDTVRHHVYSFSPAKRFDLKLYVGKPEKPVVFDAPGIAVLGCNIHDNMVGWVVILESPWFARTDAQGRARLPEVPAGPHELRTWHAGFAVGAPAQVQPLVVGAATAQAAVRVAAERR